MAYVGWCCRGGRAQGWRFFGVGVGVGVVLVAAVRFLVVWGTDAGVWWLRITAVVVALAVLAFIVNLLVRWYVRYRASAEDMFPLLAAIVLSVVAGGMSVVAFAGATTLMWRAGFSQPAGGGLSPAYALVERSFLWTLVNSVPMLAIPRRLGWNDPLPMVGMAAGAVLLAYKIVLVVPLVRVVQAGYEAVQNRWIREHDRWETTLALVGEDLSLWTQWTAQRPLVRVAPPQRPGFRLPHRWRDKTEVTGLGQLFGAAVAVAAVVGASQAARLPAPWPLVAAALVALILVIRWVIVLPGRGRDLLGASIGTVSAVCVAWMVQVTCAAAIVMSLLERAGWVTLTPVPRTPSGRGQAILEILAWQLTDALPGPNITQTLGWAQPGRLGGVAAAAVEVALLLSVVLLLAFPIGRSVRVWSRGTVEEWHDPLTHEDVPVRVKALTDAASQLGRAHAAIGSLLSYVENQKLLWYWVQRYLTFPWVEQYERWQRAGRIDRLYPSQQPLARLARQVEVELVRLQDARTGLVAAYSDDEVIGAFDEAAAAVRRYLLCVNEQRVADDGTSVRGAAADPDVLDAVRRNAEAAVAGFAALADPVDTSDQAGGWRDVPVDRLGRALRNVSPGDMLECVSSDGFRERWDAQSRWRVLAGVVSQRPATDVALLAKGMYALEKPAAEYLFGLIRRQGFARVIEVGATLAPAGEPVPEVAIRLVQPLWNLPDVAHVAVQLRAAGSPGLADETLAAIDRRRAMGILR